MTLDALLSSVAGESTVERRLQALVLGLAERVKATSNDQNVQKLARELKAGAAQTVAVVTGQGHG